MEVLGSGRRYQGSGLTPRSLLQEFGSSVEGSGSRVQGPGSRVQGSGFRVQGSGFRVERVHCRSTMITRSVIV